ncbi:hypothetical protein B0H16DRAFT_1453609 [Mycena metata]|uniref:C2H2-type domain-containing protein n=1 Tax=Mycena metata TaxID=1033252 RepID=A0AAD7NLX7_9AGAR|nr:hypothetical protein B0H16DRAFT_1453609 [Mycena metata]
MLIECTECQLPYYTYEDLEEHCEVTHPKLYRLQNRLDVRIAKRILNRHQKTYRCPCCYMPFPHPELRDSHIELGECDPEDDSDCEREPGLYGTLRRSSVDSIVNKLGSRPWTFNLPIFNLMVYALVAPSFGSAFLVTFPPYPSAHNPPICPRSEYRVGTQIIPSPHREPPGTLTDPEGAVRRRAPTEFLFVRIAIGVGAEVASHIARASSWTVSTVLDWLCNVASVPACTGDIWHTSAPVVALLGMIALPPRLALNWTDFSFNDRPNQKKRPSFYIVRHAALTSPGF